MKKFSEFYKNLKEDKLLKKEDEAEASVGELTEPAETSSDDIVDNDINHSTTEVLGKCDHQNSDKGFFGPGCMHLAQPVFGRIPTKNKKKKKKVENMNKIEKLEETHASTTDIASKIPPTFSKPINIRNRRIVSNKDMLLIINGKKKLSKSMEKIPLKEGLVTDGENTYTGDVTFYTGTNGKTVIARIRTKTPTTNEGENPGYKATYFYPTLIDIIRICHEVKETIKLDLLIQADDMDMYTSYNSFQTEGVIDDFKKSGHFKDKPNRKAEILKLYNDPDSLAPRVAYVIVLEQAGKNHMNIVTDDGVMFGYDRPTTYSPLTTAYFCDPCDVVYFLKKRKTIKEMNGHSAANVSTELLWNCLQNIITGKAHLDNNTLVKANNRRYIEVDD